MVVRPEEDQWVRRTSEDHQVDVARRGRENGTEREMGRVGQGRHDPRTMKEKSNNNYTSAAT